MRAIVKDAPAPRWIAPPEPGRERIGIHPIALGVPALLAMAIAALELGREMIRGSRGRPLPHRSPRFDSRSDWTWALLITR